MIIALSGFSLLAIGIKELTDSLSIAQILFYRNLIALLVISTIIFYKDKTAFQTRHLKQHALRNTAHFLGLYGWVFGIAFLPLAEVFALEFTTPIWTAIIAVLFLSEKLNLPRLISIALGFAGVLVILRPGIEIIHPASFAVLLGAVGYGLTHVLTKWLSRSDSPLTIIFYMTVVQLPLAMLFSLTNWQWPEGIMWLWLVIIGLCGLFAHFSMSKAMTYADANVVVPIDYLRLPLIMLLGYWLYNEGVDLYLVLGAMMMLSGNLIGLSAEKKAAEKKSRQ